MKAAQFTTLTALAAPMDEPNVDTNQLCPTRFNKVPRGPGHARILFHDLRFAADGSEKDFLLNREPYRRAGIIVGDRNFGCGSAREYAVWALYEFGIRCVVASSFGDIFLNNCYRNGVLPVVLPQETVLAIRRQLHERVGATLTAKVGTWTPASATTSVQWLRNGTAISGATGTTYTLTAADAGKRVAARVTVLSGSPRAGSTGRRPGRDRRSGVQGSCA